MSYYIAAYTSSPCGQEWQPELEAAYWSGLASIEEIEGIEHPYFAGGIHRFSDDWMVQNFPKHWTFILTLIPGTMANLEKDVEFGLASTNKEGRARALAFTHRAFEAIRNFETKIGRKACVGVEIHSAPSRDLVRGNPSSVQNFAESLKEINSWDGGQTQIFVEHCDTFVKGQEAAKGFMTFEEEVAAIELAKVPVKMTINWGRSFLESRSPATPIQQVELLLKNKELGAFIFSGVTENDPEFGTYKDSHASFGDGAVGSAFNPLSKMSQDAAAPILRALSGTSGPLIGFKSQALPDTIELADRLQYVRDQVATLQKWKEELR